MTRVVIDVAKMANGVCECERVACFAIDSDGFLVHRKRGFAVSQITLNLAEFSQGLRQFDLVGGLTTKGHRFGEVVMSVGRSVFTSSAIGLIKQLGNCV